MLVLCGTLFVAGLAGSLHCVGMCGPILLGFTRTLGRGGRLDFLAYHAGRLWTYGLLGFVAGWAGWEVRAGAGWIGGQRGFGVVAGIVVVAAGFLAAGWWPWRPDVKLTACVVDMARRNRFLAVLFTAPGFSARFLLGVVMGLLPCGLIYAVLLTSATLETPLQSALAMISFGVGTLPALQAVVFGSRLVPPRFRARGTVLVAALLVAVGLFMLGRSLAVAPQTMP